MIIKESTINSDNLFHFEGLDYDKGVYTIYYDTRVVDSQGDLKEDIVRVGIRSKSEFSRILINPTRVKEWSDGTTNFTNLPDLIEHINGLISFNAGGELGETFSITQQVNTFSDLEDGVELGELAYSENSEGVRWNPFTTYRPAGWYIWDGAEWVSDRNAIAEQLQLNINKLTINASDIDSLEQKDIDTDIALTEEIETRLQADTELETAINSETQSRVEADTALQVNLDVETQEREDSISILNQAFLEEQFNRALGEELIEKKIREYSREFVIHSNLGLINSTIAFEPFFVREALPNVVEGTWSITIPEDGDYLLHSSGLISYDSGTSDFIGQILIDGTQIEDFARVEPKDTSGVGENLPTIAGGVIGAIETSGTNQRIPASRDIYLPNLTAGTVKTFRLEFASQGVDFKATIYKAFMGLRRVINSNT